MKLFRIYIIFSSIIFHIVALIVFVKFIGSPLTIVSFVGDVLTKLLGF